MYRVRLNMCNQLRIVLLAIFLMLPSIAFGLDETLKFADLIKASPSIANSLPQSLVNKALPGSIVNINGVPYEIRFFSFENVAGGAASNVKFKDYINRNSLMESKGTVSEPIPGLKFQVFDFRSYNLKDGVYFSMALRKLQK